MFWHQGISELDIFSSNARRLIRKINQVKTYRLGEQMLYKMRHLAKKPNKPLNQLHKFLTR